MSTRRINGMSLPARRTDKYCSECWGEMRELSGMGRWFAWMLVLNLSSCTTARFLTQAAAGQWRLNREAVDIDELNADPNTPPTTRERLRQLRLVKAYGETHGLLMHENYRTYIDLKRPYVVWFVNASHPLAFLPVTFSFPVVGGFPGLSWFDETRAVEFKNWLSEYGWDVNIRGVSAFSTGGWFEDPVLSSMFYDHPASVGLFANTILHESLHATVLIPNQQVFNESLASFVADTMTPDFLRQAYPEQPELLQVYEETRRTSKGMVNKLVLAFQQLNWVYLSDIPEPDKLAFKERVIDGLMEEIPFQERPNNATLIGFQLYQEGTREFEELYAACRGSWPAFIRAADSLRAEHFDDVQTMNIGQPVRLLTAAQCQPLPARSETRGRSKQLSLRRERDARAKSKTAGP